MNNLGTLYISGRKIQYAIKLATTKYDLNDLELDN